MRVPKSMLKMAALGTTGLVSDKLAMEPTIPSNRKNPIAKAIIDPTKVPKTILRKFFILSMFKCYSKFR
jgi:hypothetical protein